jgi:TrmH family RNA methyltransferase
MLISSADNPLVRRLKRLAGSGRQCRAAKRTLIEGIHLLQAAHEHGARLHTIVLRGRGSAGEARALVDRMAVPGVQRVELSSALYDAISPVEHGAGVLAEVAISDSRLPDRISEDAIYLDGVQDPGNVGTLLRTAAAAGVKTVLAGPGCAVLWAPKVMRAGMGAHFVLRLHEEVGPETAAQRFAGVVLAADSNASEDLYGAAWGSPSLWLFGAEGRGLGSAARAIAQRRLRIPIDTRVESLNVAAAVAVCLFEQRRRRLAAK